MPTWNLWHGCHMLSPGCLHCYVYRTDSHHDRDAGEVRKTGYFDLPLRRNRQGEYKLRPEDGIVYTCFTSDFLLEDADDWREDAWAMMRKRPDLTFLFITKRIARLGACLPPDWGDGYENVHIAARPRIKSGRRSVCRFFWRPRFGTNSLSVSRFSSGWISLCI